MNINPFAVAWICIFMLKAYGLIDTSWWFVAPFALLSAIDLMKYRK